MEKQDYTIEQAIADCIEALKGGDDRSPTTIRCTINDLLDAADKNGSVVDFDYDQEEAIKEVRRVLGTGRM